MDEAPGGTSAGETPCESVTERAIHDAIDRVRRIRSKADENRAKNASHEVGGAAIAASNSAASAQSRLEENLAWLNENKKFDQSGVVRDPAGSGAVSEAARAALADVQTVRHFASVSGIRAHQDGRDSSSALECISLVEEALAPLDTLVTQALHCYIQAYIPRA